MNIFTFDIETIPDTASGKRLYNLDPNLSEKETADILVQKRLEKTEGKNEFLPHHLQRIIAISAVLKTPHSFKVWSLGDLASSEADLLERFFHGIEKYTPTLVSWNGYGFDLPVIHYRALLHGIPAPRYWETTQSDFKYNNYINRYHARHIDLMDVLASYQQKAFAKLDEIAIMLGLPGKLGMDGSKVFDSYLQGNILGIRNYCETDVLNTYLVFQRFLLIQGKITAKQYESVCAETRAFLQESALPHFQEFLQGWK